MENVIHIVERVRTTEFDGGGSWCLFASLDKSTCEEFAELANSIIGGALIYGTKDYVAAMELIAEIDPGFITLQLEPNDIHYTVTTVPLRTKS
jgi:hypothetical protein